MDLSLLTLGVTLATTVGGGVIWGIRLEGRVNGQRELFDQRGAYQDIQYSEIKQRFDRTDQKIDKVDTKLDRLLEREQ